MVAVRVGDGVADTVDGVGWMNVFHKRHCAYEVPGHFFTLAEAKTELRYIDVGSQAFLRTVQAGRNLETVEVVRCT